MSPTLLRRRLLVPAALCALITTASGASPSPPVPEDAASQAAHGPAGGAPLVVQIDVAEHPGDDSWQLTYTLNHPSPGLRFPRHRNLFRARRWHPVSLEDPAPGTEPPPPEERWTTIEGYEALVANGPPRRSFAVELASDYDPKPSDYELNIAFTDGGRLLYTGYLTAVPLACPGGAPSCPSEALVPYRGPLAYRWIFRTIPGRRVVLRGAEAKGALAWVPPSLEMLQGTFVYFGRSDPVQGDGYTAVLDPGLPTWMAERTRDLFPRILASYREETGVALDAPPLLLLSYHPGAARELRFSGGEAGGALEFSVRGHGWESEGHESSPAWIKYLAHEAFHLWNSKLFHRRSSEHGEWLSEGSAEYFALLTLERLGVLSPRAFERSAVKAANRCLTGLEGRPLVELTRPGDFESAYPCGTVVLLLTDAALGRATAERTHRRSITDLFSSLLDAPQDGDRTSVMARFFGAYRAVGGDPDALEPIQRLLFTHIRSGADAFFASELGRAGIAVERVPLEEGALDPAAFLDLLGSLLGRCDCGHPVAARHQTDALVFPASPTCQAFRQGFELTHVDGLAVTHQPNKAWADAVLRLRHGEPLRLKRSGTAEAVTFHCTEGAPATAFDTLLRPAPPPPSAARSPR